MNERIITTIIPPIEKYLPIIFSAYIFLNTIILASSFVLWRLDIINGTYGGLIWGLVLAVIVDLYQISPDIKEIPNKKYDFNFLWNTWVIRYSLMTIYLLLSLMFFEGWHKGEARGLGVLVLNPVVAGAVFIYAMFKARELSLLLISLAMLYFLYIGVATLPISVSVILGAILISLSIFSHR